MTEITQYAPLWGAWQVDSLIGEGSFGRVYKVRRDEFGKTYFSAVKLISIPQNEADLRQIRGEGMDDASLRSYFHAFVADIIQEIDLMSEFRGNSNIVSFEDHKVIEKSGQIGWDILIRMELLTSLTEHVTNKPLSHDDVIKLGIHICRALELCAVHNTIHRDIKPDNIFISRYGDYKLGDFGIARQIERTSSGLSKKGTYTYMAPEVFRGDDYGASVDMYSLGLVMYRFLNQNRTPFLPDFPTPITPRDRDSALQRRMRGEAIPAISGLDPALSEIVQKACAYDRSQRFATPTEMREALEALVGGRSYAPTLINRAAPQEVPQVVDTGIGKQDTTPGKDAAGVYGGTGYNARRDDDGTGVTEGVFADTPISKSGSAFADNTTDETMGVFSDTATDETMGVFSDTATDETMGVFSDTATDTTMGVFAGNPASAKKDTYRKDTEGVYEDTSDNKWQASIKSSKLETYTPDAKRTETTTVDEEDFVVPSWLNITAKVSGIIFFILLLVMITFYM